MEGIKIGDSGLMVSYLKMLVKDFNEFYYPSEKWDTQTQQNLLAYSDFIQFTKGINLSCFLNSAYSKTLSNYIIKNTSTSVDKQSFELLSVTVQPEYYQVCLLPIQVNRVYHIYTQNIKDKIDIGYTIKGDGENYSDNFSYLLGISQTNLHNEITIEFTQKGLGIGQSVQFDALKMAADKGLLYLCYQLPITCDSFVIVDSTLSEYQEMKALNKTYRQFYNIPVGAFGLQSAAKNYVVIPEIYQYLLDTAISPLSEDWRILALKKRLIDIKSTDDSLLNYELKQLKKFMVDTDINIPNNSKYDDFTRRCVWWLGNILSIPYNQGYVTTSIYPHLFTSYELTEEFLWS